MAIRVYADPSHYRPEDRWYLVDIAKAHWNDKSEAQRKADHGRLHELFTLVGTAEQADFCMLTMRWTWYVERRQVALAQQVVDVARRAGRPLVVFNGGDYPANVPWRDVHVFESSAYRSRNNGYLHAMPPFFSDSAAKWYGGEPPVREHDARPTVSFCGQAGGTSLEFAKRRAKNLARRGAFAVGLTRWEPPPFEHTHLRKRVIDVFARDARIRTNFVVRDQYRAGVANSVNPDHRRDTEREFVDNLVNADYTLCVRGGGNWSKRFYESLCLGRMPMLVDTDCLLPFERAIDWSSYCVIADAAHLGEAPGVLAERHQQLDPAEFKQRQVRCRNLWREWLTADGFYAHLPEELGLTPVAVR